MKRVPEPELMDDEDQARAYSQADFAEPHQRFVTLFQERFSGAEISGDVLDLGCGPADVTTRFALAFPRCAIDGLDGAEAMLCLGRERLAKAGLSSRVALYCARLPKGAPPRAAYDVVLSSSLLHHLEDPGALWQAIARYGKPGALVFAMDLMRPQSRESAERLVDEHAKDAPEVLRHDFFASLLASYEPDEVRAQLEAAGLGALRVEVVGDRHLIVWGRRP